MFHFLLQRTHEKTDLFKLNEEEDLTHYGQSLSQIEKFEDTVHSESEDEDDRGKIAGEASGKLSYAYQDLLCIFFMSCDWSRAYHITMYNTQNCEFHPKRSVSCVIMLSSCQVKQSLTI